MQKLPGQAVEPFAKLLRAILAHKHRCSYPACIAASKLLSPLGGGLLPGLHKILGHGWPIPEEVVPAQSYGNYKSALAERDYFDLAYVVGECHRFRQAHRLGSVVFKNPRVS